MNNISSKTIKGEWKCSRIPKKRQWFQGVYVQIFNCPNFKGQAIWFEGNSVESYSLVNFDYANKFKNNVYHILLNSLDGVLK